MIDNKNMMQKFVALILAFIGVVAMAYAWFILLTTASHDTRIIGIEVGGVIFAIIGYFLWMHSNKSCKNKSCELPEEKSESDSSK